MKRRSCCGRRGAPASPAPRRRRGERSASGDDAAITDAEDRASDIDVAALSASARAAACSVGTSRRRSVAAPNPIASSIPRPRQMESDRMVRAAADDDVISCASMLCRIGVLGRGPACRCVIAVLASGPSIAAVFGCADARSARDQRILGMAFCIRRGRHDVPAWGSSRRTSDARHPRGAIGALKACPPRGTRSRGIPAAVEEHDCCSPVRAFVYAVTSLGSSAAAFVRILDSRSLVGFEGPYGRLPYSAYCDRLRRSRCAGLAVVEITAPLELAAPPATRAL